MAAEKKVLFEIIEKHEAGRKLSEPYQILERMLVHHPELSGCRIGLAWKLDVKEDKDAHVMLGMCRKMSDLDRLLCPFDFIIILNRTAWEENLLPDQRAALVDHECCHAAPSMDDETGKQKTDTNGELVWRVRKHDIEEFREVVQRHGTYKADLARFVEAARERDNNPMFGDEQEPIAGAVGT